MAPVIWGLDLGEITWDKFGNKNMWNTRYHLRRSKIIFYQLAMIFCVVSDSLGTAVLSDYIKQESFIREINSRAVVYNNDYVGVASYNIFSSIFLAFVFGGAFFFDLIWPERHEDRGIKWAWKLCAIAAVVFEVSAAFALTVITATRSAYFTGVGPEEAARLLKLHEKPPLRYASNGRAVTAVVFVWPGTIFAIISAVLLWMSYAHDERLGDPYSTHYRQEVAMRTKADPEADFIERTASFEEPPPGTQGSIPAQHHVGGTTTTENSTLPAELPAPEPSVPPSSVPGGETVHGEGVVPYEVYDHANTARIQRYA